jgi:uncharacterized integral membrane protein
MTHIIQNEYVAGVCNIGSEETTRRRNLGWVALVAALVLLLVLLVTGVNPCWRLFVFFPATVSASGFLQAYFHFCVGFAHSGVYNFGSLGQTREVGDEPSKSKDKRRGNWITLYAALIGTAIAIIGAVLM